MMVRTCLTQIFRRPKCSHFDFKIIRNCSSCILKMTLEVYLCMNTDQTYTEVHHIIILPHSMIKIHIRYNFHYSGNNLNHFACPRWSLKVNFYMYKSKDHKEYFLKILRSSFSISCEPSLRTCYNNSCSIYNTTLA